MVQQVVEIDPQAAQPQPAGRKRPEGAEEFRSLMGSAVREAGAEENRKGAASGPAGAGEKSGGKRTDRGAERQGPAMWAPVPVSSYPAGFLLPSAGFRPADAAKAVPLDTIAPVSASDDMPATEGSTAVESGAADALPGQAAMPQDGRSLIRGAGEPAVPVFTPGAAADGPPQEAGKPEMPVFAQGAPVEADATPDGRPQEAGEPEMPVPAQSAQPQQGAAAEEPSPAAQAIRTANPAETDGGAVGPPGQPEEAPEQPGIEVVSGRSGSSESGAAGDQSPEPGPLAAKSSEARPAGETRKDVSASSLSDLYGNGNVVIRVSEKPAEKAPSPLRQVADAAADQLRQGKSEFRMELYPQSLGKVSIRLTSGKGLLTVEIAASDPKTQSLLLSGSEEIRNILQSSTGRPAQTLFPDRREAGWYGGGQSEQGDGGGDSDRQRRKKEEAKDGRFHVDGVNADMNTGDFLAVIRSLGAFAR